MTKPVRVRFAPSPTGALHIGGIRTALYNYLLARQTGGTMILRIEDTDQNRFVPGAEEFIIESLKWVGITIDEGQSVGGPYTPYRQSERKHLYKKYVDQLLASAKAYYAFDSEAEIEAMRIRLKAEGNDNQQYGIHSRLSMRNSLSLNEAETNQLLESGAPYVIRAKIESGKQVVVNDLIRGSVTVQSDTLDDKVLMKSDGMPTYHLANVVDDYLMKISHVIRGEEWLPSAPLHVLLYQYFGWQQEMPQFAHLPLLLKPDGNGKLSKRDGDRLGFPVFPLDWNDPFTGEKSSGYRERGYYPEAFVNMLAFLGWNPGTEQEIFSLEELCAHFSFEHIHKAGAKFDPEKAKWFNEHYLRTTESSELGAHIKSDVQQTFNIAEDDRRLSTNYLTKAAELLKPRVQFEHEMKTTGAYLFQAPETYDETVVAKKWKPELRPFFEGLQTALAALPAFETAHIDETIKSTAASFNLKPGEIMQLLRVIVSGQAGGVDLLGMIELLGQTEISERMTRALSRIGQ